MKKKDEATMADCVGGAVTAVAFLGLGAIGRPMAVRVAARFPLTVWNRTAARATELAAETGARAGGDAS